MVWLFLGAALCLSAVMLIGWAFQWAAHNGGWTDVFWTFGMGLVGAAFALMPPAGDGATTPRQELVAALAAIWSLRLGLHIFRRVSRGPEDARYARFRIEWAPHVQRGMLVFLQLQALAGALLLSAVVVAARRPGGGLGLQDLLGALIMVGAVLGEGAADRQLARFSARPENRGKVCDTGLWAWSRHPNYFFEWIGWLAYPMIAFDVSGAYRWGWIAIAAPAYMYWLLRYVSGVPPLEAHMLRSRTESFRAYQARTSVFFPRRPRSPSGVKPLEPR